MATDSLRVGDRFVVRPGEKVATDGVVAEGSSAVDNSLVTGESVPVEVGPGDEVIGATVNAGGRLVVQATRVGSTTTLARMTRLVAEAQSGKAEVQRLADRVSAVFVPVVIGLALATFVFWLARGDDVAAALAPAVAVLIVACPCALGLATPTALLVGTGRGAQLGVLIRGPEVLESTRRVDTMVLDKTGTVTAGRMSFRRLEVIEGVEARATLHALASLEAASEHPVGRAIAAAVSGEDRLPVEDFQATPGLGVRGLVGGHTIVAGRTAFLAEAGAGLPPALEARREEAEASGQTVVAVAIDGRAVGLATVADTMRPDSPAAVAALRDRGLSVVLLTGDHEAAARSVAAAAGIDEVVASVLPAGKVDVVARLQEADRTVAMVGDGVNDAPALARADLGLAMGTGSDVARDAADITVVRANLSAVVDAIDLSRRTLRTIEQNLGWAFAYNVAAIPVAMAGLLNPMLAGLAMACSSVFVVTNSLRLFRFQPWSAGPQATAAAPGPLDPSLLESPSRAIQVSP